MTIAAGSRLGPYEILASVGAGGMGEVFRARDTRLDRTVAIKVLSAHLSESEELRQRFEREAKTISQLSHPHICALYDIGREDGTDYLVMEFLEGETLADRLGKGPLPAEQLLRYGIEIADALDKAHRQGFVHRDLKPGNIMLTTTGVKLLDFGLAKFQPGARGALSGVSRFATEAAPSAPLTERGTVLGTFQYMAPEQLEGGEADARSDIFAFGAVLYEMATGRKAFLGKSQASLIGSILRDDPPAVSELSPMTPPALNRVIKTCLAKDAEDRFQTAHDVKLQLQWIAEGGSAAGVPAPVVARRKSREQVAWVVAAAGILAAGAFAFGYVRRAPAEASAVRFRIPPPEGLASFGTPKISPDGKYLAFNATDSTGKSMIWLRPLSALEAQPMPGTDRAGRPFWSPDSRFIGFFAGGKLKKVEVSGGPPQTVCDAPTGADGAWSPNGTILFDGRSEDPIMRVPASGGVPTVLVKLDKSRGEVGVGWPQFLPDGRYFLYQAQASRFESSAIRMAELGSNTSREVTRSGSRFEYAPPGYLLFVREGTLVAQPFDWKSGTVSSEPFPVVERVGTGQVGLAHFSVSGNGVLTYGTGEASNRRLVWVDRAGKELGAIGDPARYSDLALSPDETRLAMTIDDPRASTADIWVRDLARGVSSRFTFSPDDDSAPTWSPDGSRIVYLADRGGKFEIVRKLASGAGGEEVLRKSETAEPPDTFSRDGRFLSYYSRQPGTSWDVGILPLAGDRKPIPFLSSQFVEVRPRFSPDGRWIAYDSNESGQMEVYVQAFPGPGGKWQISTAGGSEPQWRRDGKELFYLAPDSKLMSVDATSGESFQAGVPKPLFLASLEPIIVRNRYAASADGKRFVLLSPIGRPSMPPTTVILNWTAGLAKK